jgi:iron complex transport system substrate-binding protein
MRRPPAILLATLAATLALAAATLAGCGSGKAASPAGPAPSTSDTTDTGTFPVTVDGTTLTAKPARIVSLSPTATDMLFAIGAGPQVVAVDLNSHYPATAPKGDLDAYKPSAEAISAKNPDLVVLSNDTNKIQEQLTALKIPVYLAPAANTLDDTYHQETALGALTGHVNGAAAVVNAEKQEIASELAGIPARSKPLSFYYELDQTYYSVTSKTFIGSLFAMAKMVDIADPADANGKAFGYPQLSAEAIVRANPDLIFLADSQCCGQSLSTVKARAGWSAISAVKGGRVITIPDDVASQWGTRVPDLLQAIVTADKAVPAS